MSTKQDFRGATYDQKRFRDHSSKWAHGSQPMRVSRSYEVNPGGLGHIVENILDDRPVPQKGPSRHSNSSYTPNVTKPRSLKAPANRRKLASWKQEELDSAKRSPLEADELPGSGASVHTFPKCSDNISNNKHSNVIMYSFDHSSSPRTLLPLEVFVKDGKQTEKMVETEYGIVDEFGEEVTGKRHGRRVLRHGGRTRVEEESIVEDDGFELV